MTLSEWLGTIAVASLLALLSISLFRMRPRWPWLALAGSVLLLEFAVRWYSPSLFPRHNWYGLTHEINPMTSGEEDLVWPNRILIFLLTSLVLWLTVRPIRRALIVGTGCALVVAGGWPNLIEPWIRGYTTDYIALGAIVLNLADFCLIVGLPVLLLGVVHYELTRRKSEEAPERRTREV